MGQAPKSATLADVTAFTEDQAREYLEAIRWPNGPVCPHCGSVRATRLQGKSTAPGTLKCKNCRTKFTVRVGAIFEDSPIPLRKWVIAFHLLCSSKKGFSAKQLQRNLGLGSYEAAWFMAHRIRLAMATGSFTKGPLSGTVEVDETYIGGKPRKGSEEKAKRGRGTKKAAVMVLVERGGKARAMPIERVNADTLKPAIREHVERSARIVTDEWSAYEGIGGEFAGGHETVNHGTGEYARDDVHTNTAESYFALLKRGVYGTFHHVSKTHLHRYCDEFSFRWSLREVTDGERAVAAIMSADGRRLTYS
jgi:transposase-like protein